MILVFPNNIVGFVKFHKDQVGDGGEIRIIGVCYVKFEEKLVFCEVDLEDEDAMIKIVTALIP